MAERDAAITEHTVLGGRVRLRQLAEGYRAAIDPVLLAAAVPQVCCYTRLPFDSEIELLDLSKARRR